LGQGLWLGIAAGTISMLALLVGIPTLIRAVGLSAEAAIHAEAYLKILAVSGPVSGALFALNAALRGAGDTSTPFIGMCVVNGVNIAVSWSLALGEQMGVRGIAWGTVAGWTA